MKKIIILVSALALLYSCAKKVEPIAVSPEDLHASVDKVIEIMIHDIFSPPVASRIFAYPNIAAYEIIALENPKYLSLAGQLTDFTAIPKPKETITINSEVAALVAHMELSKRLIFSEDKMEMLRDSLYGIWSARNPLLFNDSKAYGLEVAEHVAEWMNNDNYNQTRTMPKFTVDTEDPTRWQPTPPAYMDGIEPHWNKIRPFVIDSASQFKPIPPPKRTCCQNSLF